MPELFPQLQTQQFLVLANWFAAAESFRAEMYERLLPCLFPDQFATSLLVVMREAPQG